jgi:Tol biopolymer transport system component
MVGADGENLRDITDLPEGGVSLDVSPDGDRAVYIANAHPDVFLVDLRSGLSTPVGSSIEGSASDVAWSPIDDRVAVQTGGSIVLMRVDGSDTRRLSSDALASFDDFFDLAWTSDGRWILLSAREADDVDLDIYALGVEEGDVDLVASTPAEDSSPVFVP